MIESVILIVFCVGASSAFTSPTKFVAQRTNHHDINKVLNVETLMPFQTVERNMTDTDNTVNLIDSLADEWTGLSKSLKQQQQQQQQCFDIAKDLDGRPLSAAFLSNALGGINVESYVCPEEEAFRGLMSNGCRIYLQPTGTSVFYKLIEFASLGHAQDKQRTAPNKLIRDVKSYSVVVQFLSSRACQSVKKEAGLRIPKCYAFSARQPDSQSPLSSSFSVLLEDFSSADGWRQRWLIENPVECKAALTMFAKMHSYFWHGSSFWQDKFAAKELEEGVWESASYIQPMLQAPNQCKEVARGWAKHKLQCQEKLESYDYWEDLGKRLERVAEDVGLLAHPFADEGLAQKYAKYRTFTHGDPKQANLFFRGDTETEVGLIDFQWCGFGLAGTDLAHFVTSAVHVDLLDHGGEESMLVHYYQTLIENLVLFRAFPTIESAKEEFSYAKFVEQYETAVLDICRIVIAYNWRRFDPVLSKDYSARLRTMNLQSYNKYIPNAVWLMSKCDDLLKARGV